jgi:hypothetical protein
MKLFDLNFSLDEDGDIMRSRKVLDTYSEADVFRCMDQFGITAKLRSQNFVNLQVTLDTSDPFVHTIRVTDASLMNEIPEKSFLCQLFVRRKDISPWDMKSFIPKEALLPEVVQLIEKKLRFDLKISSIEYICMQNPKVSHVWDSKSNCHRSLLQRIGHSFQARNILDFALEKKYPECWNICAPSSREMLW